MAKQWTDIAADPAFQDLPDADKDVVRESYFERVVAPEVAPAELTATRDRFERASGFRSRALPEGVKPSDVEGGRGRTVPKPPKDIRSDLSGVMGGIRANEAARAQRLGQTGEQPLPADVAPSAAGAGRGRVNPYNIGVRTTDQPFADKREALDEAVNLIEDGADPEQVYGAFEQNSGGSILRSEIQQHGLVRRSPAFTADPNAGPARPGATDGTMAEDEPSAAQGLANFGKRVAARTSQTATGVLAQTGVFGTEGLAASLARDQKRLEAAAPGKEVQRELEDLGQVKTFSEVPAAIIQNPRGTAMMLFESLAMTAPMMAATGARLGAKGLGAVTGIGSGGLEFGSVLSDMLSDKGISMLDAEKVKRALDDPRFMDAVRKKAATRGLTVGAVDALTAGFAGRFIEPALAAVRAGKLTGAEAMRSTAGAWAKELGVQMAGGAGGEFAAQKATGENKPLDVAVEALAEGIGAPLEAMSNLREARRAQTMAAFERAAARGFHVKPPLTTDPPDTQVSKRVGAFKAMAAQFGIPSEAVSRATKATDGMPAEKVGPFLGALLKAYEARGVTAAPVDPLIAGLLSEPAIEPAQPASETKAPEGETKPAAGGTEAPSRETAAVASIEQLLGTRQEPAAADDTGLSEIEGDLKTHDGQPYGTRASAAARATREGAGEVVEVPGGWVVRPSPVTDDSSANRRPTGSDLSANGGVAQPGFTKSFDSLNIKSKRVVKSRVLSALQDREVLESVVELVPVDVMNVLIGGKFSTKTLLDQPSVLLDRLASAFDDPVRSSGIGLLINAVATGHPNAFAGLAAEEKAALGVGNAVRTDTEVGATSGATNLGSHSANYGPAQPDVQPTPGVAAPAPSGRGAQPTGGGGTVGRVAAGAARPVQPPAAPAAPGVRAPAPVGSGGERTKAVGRVIANVGMTPKQAAPLELRDNPDGSATPYLDGSALLDFNTAEPVNIPVGATDAQALQAIRDAGALSRRQKVYGLKAEGASDATEEVTQQTGPRGERQGDDEGRTPEGPVVRGSVPSAARGEGQAPSAEVGARGVLTEPPSETEQQRTAAEERLAASSYAALEGRTLEQQVQVADTGETVILRMDAAKAMRMLDERLKALRGLADCLRKAA